MKIRYYMDILKCIANETVPSAETVTHLSLQEMCDFSMLNKVLPLAAELLPYWNAHTSEEQKLVANWKAEAMHLVFGEHKKLYLVKQLVAEASKSRLQLVFFKGYLLAELYKNFALRNSSDTDILVNANDLEQAILLLDKLGYQSASELDTKNVYTFVYKEAGMVVHKIELHTALYDDASEAEQKQLKLLCLSEPEKFSSVNCCGMELNTLPCTEHLIYQMIHMVKHLRCHGFPARYLVDTALFIRKYEKEIDWLRVKNAMECLGYDGFYSQMLSILVYNFDLPAGCCCGEKLRAAEETEELLQDILRFGARACGKELSGAFYYFEEYIEKLEEKAGKRLGQIAFDGTTVPLQIVPIEYQQSEQLQKRIRLLQNLSLI